MKLADIKTQKTLLQYLAEFILKRANFEAVQQVVGVQKEANAVIAAIEAQSIGSLKLALNRLSKFEGGVERIQKIHKNVNDEVIKGCFAKYIA